jgi:hypothetical protein
MGLVGGTRVINADTPVRPQEAHPGSYSQHPAV